MKTKFYNLPENEKKEIYKSAVVAGISFGRALDKNRDNLDRYFNEFSEDPDVVAGVNEVKETSTAFTKFYNFIMDEEGYHNLNDINEDLLWSFLGDDYDDAIFDC